jgi:hypothetical protein
METGVARRIVLRLLKIVKFTNVFTIIP